MSKKRSLIFTVFVNIAIIIIILFALEAGARIFLYFTRGASTVGLPERTQQLNYKPFVMFGPDWGKVLAPAKYPGSEKGKGVYKILLLGGSTAAGFPTDILEDAFHGQFPERKFRVINAAESGYNARQELIVCSVWGIGAKPDMIITLDGANDFIHRIRMKGPGTFFLDNAYRLALTRPFLSPFLYIMRRSQLVHGLFRLKERGAIGSVEAYSDAVPVYISAEHSINVIAGGLDAKRIMVLQPFMSFKEPLSEGEAGFTPYKYREQVMIGLYNLADRKLRALAELDNVIYLDTRPIYNGMKKTVFSDDVHFVSDEGYRILADRIASSVSEL